MRLIKKFLVLFLVFLLVTSSLPVFAAAAGSNTGAGCSVTKAEYLLDEDFSDLSSSSNIVVSGWDVKAAGGKLSYGFYSWFKISDTSNVLPVTMNKKFISQNSGKITLVYRFKPTVAIDGLKWQLRSGSTVGVNIYTSGTNLYMDTAGGGSTLLQAYTASTEYGVKVIADITQNKADVYINGVLKASNVAFKSSVSSLDNFYLSTGETSTGDVYMPTVKIYKGYTVNERFITTMANLPGDWTSSTSGGTIIVEKVDNASPPDYYSLKMDATNSTAAMTFRKNIPAQSGAQVFEYKVLFPQKVDGLSAELLNGNTCVFKLVTADGKLCYVDGSGQSVPVYDYIANLWYSIKIKLDTATSKADIYINSKLKIQGADLAASCTGIDGINYSTSAANKGIMYLDDIQLYNDTPLPSDYVPAPNKVSSNDILVGTQSCSLWREGHHRGWDRINPYPDRKPMLGYYDEGNPETADWEIKWMAEHGISFQMFCWYRDRGSITEGKPIKEPDLSTALNNGYMNAKYSDQVDFTIMWENQNSKAKDSADFRNNIVPYWIEYYIKDSRYLVVDNKPVIAIYSLNNLKSFFGGTVEGVKAEMDYLRSEVKKLGFDDATLLICNSNTDAVTMSECKAAGFDAVFTYSWGSLSGYPDIQKTKLQQQKEAGTIDMVPVISMGRDDSAWGDGGICSGYYSTPGEFQSVAQWVKDTLVPSLPDTSPGKKMVLMDNWNEFGEGHFIAPAALNGFGYLDAIRNVFAGGGTHEDVAPTQAQKDRVCVLYPQDRTLPAATTYQPPEITNTYTMQWEFNTDGNAENWGSDSTKIRFIENIHVAGGSISFDSTGWDPWIVSPDNLGFSAEDNSYIHIKMKNGTNDAFGKIYFITEADQIWNEAKSVSFVVKPNDSGYTDYYVDMCINSKWTGKVKAFRLDPSTAVGSISIDSIGVVYSPMQGIKTNFDGMSTKLLNQAKVIDGCPMLPIEDVYKKLSIPKQWNDNTQKLIAVKDGSIYELTPDQTTAYKDSTPITLEHAPVFSDAVLYVPASFLKQAFGYMVSWNEQDQEISIYTSSLTWNFTSDDGWTANERISNGRISNGYYLGTSMGTGTGGDEGYITSKDKLNIDAASIKRIRINYMNSTPGNQLKLYFTTASDPVWDTNKMMNLPAVISDSSYREYVFDTSSFSGWNGVIRQIRIVPSNAVGDFGIDYINMDITSSVPVKGENLIIDPGMELGSNTQITNTRSVSEYSTVQAHSGNQSIKVTKQGTYGSIYFRNLNQVKGQEYYYSAWLKLDENSVSQKNSPAQYPVARVCIGYRLDGVLKQYIMFTSDKLSITEWKQVQGTYTINETGAVTDVCMSIYTDSPDACDTFYLDDVEISPVAYTTSPAWVYVSGVSLDKTSATIGLGKAQAISATVEPANAVNKSVKWSSDNTDVAIVDNNGYIYGKNQGIANITATTAEGGKTATCAVTVGAKAIGDNVVIDPGMELGSSTQIINISSVREYSTAQAHIGNQSIKVTKQGAYGSIYFRNLPQVKGQEYYYSAWLKLDENSVSLKNSPAQYPVARVCIGYRLDGVLKQYIMFTSNKLSSTEWKQVQGTYVINESGTVTDVRMFIYTDLPDACDTFYLDDVEIRPVTYAISPAFTFDSLNIATDRTVINIGDTVSLVLTGTMGDGTAADMTKASIYYTSGNEQVAAVDQNGTITAVGEGTAGIKASVKINGIIKVAEIQITVDGTSPVTTSEIRGTSVNEWYTGDVTITLSSSDDSSGVDKTEYRLSDSSDWITYTAPVIIMEDGSYTVQCRSTDKAGNVEEIKQTIVKLDTTAPVTTAAAIGIVRSDGTYNSHVSVTLAAEDTAGGSGVAGIQYSLDGTTWQAYTAPLEFNVNGTYSISYKATDNAGNVEAVKNVSILISMDPAVMVSYLNEKVNGISMEEGIKNSLISKLDNVLSSIADGNKNSPANKLNAFINEVDAQSGKKLTVEQADALKAEANKIIIKINQ